MKASLPRLPPEFYHDAAFVHWTLTIQDRAKGWLTPDFHHAWQLGLLHTCCRYHLSCPAYVLMPDHVHLLWLGTANRDSDQRTAVEFLRKHLRPHLTPADWQHQAHHHVLRETDRERGAFQTIAHYIFENPVRSNLAARWSDYLYLDCCVPGYPALDLRAPDYWDLFWRIHQRLFTAR